MTRDDEVRRRLGQMRWAYAEQDSGARQELQDKIVAAASRRWLITYSDLVRGVEFRLASVNGGRPFVVEEWTDNDRAVVGDFLGMLNAESYERDGIFVSALVVLKEDGTPGPGFMKFMLEIGALRSVSEAALFWAREVAKVHEFYASRPASSKP